MAVADDMAVANYMVDNDSGQDGQQAILIAVLLNASHRSQYGVLMNGQQTGKYKVPVLIF